MRYLSLFSGIEAASVAWGPLGWVPAAFAEIEPFCCAVLAHHYPEVPNLGDVRGVTSVPAVDVLIGGSPCQSFSVAGKRLGMDDPRGNLALEFLRVARDVRPRWVVYENVPGLLSSGGGRDFGAFLWALGQCGYGFAYRVLDAQHFGVAQRRRRLFVVGHLGDWRRAAAVLFERPRLPGHLAESSEAREGPTPGLAKCLRGRSNLAHREDADTRVSASVTSKWSRQTGGPSGDECQNLIAAHETGKGFWTEGLPGLRGQPGGMPENIIAHTLRVDGFDASEDGTGRGTPLVPVASFYPTGGSRGVGNDVDVAPPIKVGSGLGIPSAPAIAFCHKDYGGDASVGDTPTLRANDGGGCNSPAVAFQLVGDRDDPSVSVYEDTAPTLAANPMSDRMPSVAQPLRSNGYNNSDPDMEARMHIQQGMKVRRLTPRECERLQGFPDDYTQVDYRGKPAADGPRYRALGNSMAVPVIRWLGERIAYVEEVLNDL